MKYSNVIGYAANEAVSIREDNKVVRIGKHFCELSNAQENELSNAEYHEKLALAIRFFNEQSLALEDY